MRASSAREASATIPQSSDWPACCADRHRQRVAHNVRLDRAAGGEAAVNQRYTPWFLSKPNNGRERSQDVSVGGAMLILIGLGRKLIIFMARQNGFQVTEISRWSPTRSNSGW